MEGYMLEATALHRNYECYPCSPRGLDSMSPGSATPLHVCTEFEVVSPGGGDPL